MEEPSDEEDEDEEDVEEDEEPSLSTDDSSLSLPPVTGTATVCSRRFRCRPPDELIGRKEGEATRRTEEEREERDRRGEGLVGRGGGREGGTVTQRGKRRTGERQRTTSQKEGRGQVAKRGRSARRGYGLGCQGPRASIRPAEGG